MRPVQEVLAEQFSGTTFSEGDFNGTWTLFLGWDKGLNLAPYDQVLVQLGMKQAAEWFSATFGVDPWDCGCFVYGMVAQEHLIDHMAKQRETLLVPRKLITSKE